MAEENEETAEIKEVAETVKSEKPEKHSRKKKAFDWVEMKPEEIIELIKKLSNEGVPKSEIGMILRDQHGIPEVRAITGKTVSDILKEQGTREEIPEDLMNLIRRSVTIKEHMGPNPKDMTAKRGYQMTVSKIRKLVEYYKKKGLLPGEWNFTEEKAKLLVK
ncbi:MAG: 30S ribosomal protein S15 [Candidatus Diapherotrites archaeon]|nr:30S ribosomal protein S15 [Candidatus Diapherotrites archaeon]